MPYGTLDQGIDFLRSLRLERGGFRILQRQPRVSARIPAISALSRADQRVLLSVLDMERIRNTAPKPGAPSA